MKLEPQEKSSPSPQISFLKMQSLGNDFIIIDTRTHPFNPNPELIRQMSDRHTGIGCDQFIILRTADQGRNPQMTDHVFMEIFNQDGSPAVACGNATRCVAKLLFEEQDEVNKRIRTADRQLLCHQIGHDQAPLISVDMGRPYLDAKSIPVHTNYDPLQIPYLDYLSGCGLSGCGPSDYLPPHKLDQPISSGQSGQAGLHPTLKNGVSVGMGNPHCILFVENLDQIPIQKIGPGLEHHPAFPERTNVEFVEIINRRHLRQRTWERGAGETFACGSGACAVTVAAVLQGLSERKVQVELTGGMLEIEWRSEDDHVIMVGPASHVFSGKYYGKYS